MTSFDLTRLDSTSFEKLVRALAFSKFGPSGNTFPTGPDGARDFAVEGAIKGFEGKGWSGYLILQSKFLETLRGGDHDLKWLEKQLGHELDKFQNAKRNLRRPEYYIIATNIRLSGADGHKRKGGHTKISEVLDGWRSQIGLKDFHIWGADHISDLIATNEGVRRSFAAFTLPGDVLSAMLTQFGGQSKDFGRVIRRALKDKIVTDQYVPLQESGAVDHKKVPTSKVFIDLPVKRNTQEQDDKSYFVESVLQRSRMKFDQEPVEKGEAVERQHVNRIVLLGGPGQGKSTAGLFLIQLLRAICLRDDPTSNTDPAVASVITQVHQRARQQHIPTALPRRFPVHVLLPRYADKLSEAIKDSMTPPSLLAHIALELGKAADGEVTRDDLRTWLSEYPWLIVLDGLDEVPPSGERPRIIDNINRFMTEVSDCSADALVVVTSRPQGYNQDLEPKLWEHWTLTDLSKANALSYAHALSEALHQHDTDRQNKINDGIKAALNQPATARLMVSPLQVTILHLIVDGGGSAPVGRWSLFNEYYQLLKKRERSKGGGYAKVLEDNRDHIDPVHHRCGMVLQTESEIAGRAGATFSPPRLRQLINNYLKVAGYDADKRKDRAEALTNLALHRLVMLTAKQQGASEDDSLISFDIRSLQEFMAAAQITTEREPAHDEEEASSPRIEDRLIHIAGLAHWRHAFLIAASRCFSDTALYHLRSAVVSVPRTLDTNEPDRLARSGARLALDMLADGIAVNHPTSRRKLVAHAMELLDLGPRHFDFRLGGIWTQDSSEIIFDGLRTRIQQGGTDPAKAAWIMLLLVRPHGDQQSAAIIKEFWPTRDDELVAIIRRPEFLPSDLQEVFRSALQKNTIAAVRDFLWEELDYSDEMPPHTSIQTGLRDVFQQNPGDKSATVRVGTTNISVQYVSVRSVFLDKFDFLSLHPTWLFLERAKEFAHDPSAGKLASILNQIGREAECFGFDLGAHLTPWPLANILCACRTRDDIFSAASLASNGGFGDIKDWEAAEARWSTVGITEKDLIASDAKWGLDAQIGTEGGLIDWSASSSVRGEFTEATLPHLGQLLLQIKNSRARRSLNLFLQFHRVRRTGKMTVAPDLVLKLLDKVGADYGMSWEYLLDTTSANDLQIDKLSSKLEAIVRVWHHRVPDTEENFNAFKAAFMAKPARMGLLNLLLGMWLDGNFSRQALVDDLPASAFQFKPEYPRELQTTLIFLRMAKGLTISLDMLRAMDTTIGHRMIVRVMNTNLVSKEKKIEFMSLMLGRRLHSDGEMGSDLVNLLKRELDARRSKLTSRAMWVNLLGLPTEAYEVLRVTAEPSVH